MVVVVFTGGVGGAGFVAAGGGVVFFGVCCVLGVRLAEELDGALLDGAELSVVLGEVLGVDEIQLELGVLFCGASSATP